VTSEGFEQTVEIHTISKKFSVLIQTDKAVYKPNDDVQFRVLVLDADMRPHRYETLQVKVFDPSNNNVTHHKFEPDFELLYNGTYTLSDDAYQGDWKISVQVDKDLILTNKTFEVKEYVLPYFEAFIDSEPIVVLSGTKLFVEVYAKYNFGKLVEGEAKVTAKCLTGKKEYNLQVTEKKQIQILIGNDLNIRNVASSLKVDLEVEFKEKGTGKVATKSSSIIIKSEDTRYQIVIDRPQVFLRPGHPYSFKVNVLDFDGSVVTQEDLVEVDLVTTFDIKKCTRRGTTPEMLSKSSKKVEKTLKNGKAEFTLDVTDVTNSIKCTVNFKRSSVEFYVKRFPSKSREYLKAEITTEK
jgi:CD109 antigen